MTYFSFGFSSDCPGVGNRLQVNSALPALLFLAFSFLNFMVYLSFLLLCCVSLAADLGVVVLARVKLNMRSSSSICCLVQVNIIIYRLLMGKQQDQRKMLQKRKNRKDIKTQKGQGNFKKFTKNDLNKPPNLTQFKSKMVQALKSKEADRNRIIENLEKQKLPNLLSIMKQRDFEEEIIEENDGFDMENFNNFQQSGKYWKEMKKIIEACDIILQVLDARDPMSCRCKTIERKILSLPDKKIILVLNKIDLVPMENAYAWQTYLRREFPVVMFKANLQNQGSHLSSFNLFKKSIADSTDMADTLIHSTKSIGADHLVQLLKQLSKIEGSNRAVTVGLIGYPNVGKSSVINSLKRTKACQVSSIPGCTKNLQQVKLDSQVKMLDCPGVIFQKDLTRNQMILQNTAKYGDDLDEVVDAILERIPQKDIIQYYKIEPYNTTIEFLAKICRAHGKLGKGGVPQMKQGAKLVVQDWNKGNLKYFTIPPLQQERQKDAANLLSSMMQQ